MYLLNNAIEKKKCSNMYTRAGQQGKGTDSCPEITEPHRNYTVYCSLTSTYYYMSVCLALMFRDTNPRSSLILVAA